MMTIRKIDPKDIEAVLKIYEHAKEFMHTHGNPAQWADGYPNRKSLEADYENGVSYVCLDGENICGTFALLLTEEPTYRSITGGSWRKDASYGTIHRIASDGKTRGVSKAVFDFCSRICPYLRADTHENNLPMQRALVRYGFKSCGTIYVSDGTPRIAFDYIRE